MQLAFVPSPPLPSPKLEDTLALVRVLSSTGVAAIAVHGRDKGERSKDPVHSDVIRRITEAVDLPVIAKWATLVRVWNCATPSLPPSSPPRVCVCVCVCALQWCIKRDISLQRHCGLQDCHWLATTHSDHQGSMAVAVDHAPHTLCRLLLSHAGASSRVEPLHLQVG